MAETNSYEAAIRQLEDIVDKMENNELSLDKMTDELKKAQKLIKMCRDKLTKTDKEIKQLLEQE